MTSKDYSELPKHMTEGLKKCKCGGNVALHYKEGQLYNITCIRCGCGMMYFATSEDNAKSKWNNRKIKGEGNGIT